MGKRKYARLTCEGHCNKEFIPLTYHLLGDEKKLRREALSAGWKIVDKNEYGKKIDKIFCPECYIRAEKKRDAFLELLEREAKVYDFETVRVLTSLDGNIAYAKFYNITVWRGNFGSGYGKYFHKAKAEEVKTIILADECERLDYEYQDKLKVVIEETEYLIGELTLFLKYEKEMRERGVL